MKILITGAAGFIGFHTSLRLVQLNHDVVGIDNLNDYYDVSLKNDRLNHLLEFPHFRFSQMDINDIEMQPGDVLTTYADISPLKELIGYEPKTTLKDGLQIFVDWFKNYKEKRR
jgi:nucleoside-diphosphate-sugar epimerase